MASSVSEMISSVAEVMNSKISPWQQRAATWHIESELRTLVGFNCVLCE